MNDLYLGLCIPSTGLCRIEFAASLAKLMVALVQIPVFPLRPQKLHLRVVQSSGISTNREQLVTDCLADGCTHIAFMDEDMSFPPGALHHLLRHEQPMVVANYRLRAKGGDFSAMSLDRETRIQTTRDSTGLEECAFAGFGLAVIDRVIFATLPQPWFPIRWNPGFGRYSTEDQPFCEAVRAAGFPIYVDHAVSKAVHHIGHYVYRFDDNGFDPVGAPPDFSPPPDVMPRTL